MDALVVLVIAALLPLLGVMVGLWTRQWLSRDAGIEKVPRAAAVAGTSGPHMLGGSDLDSEGVRTCPSARSTLRGLGGGAGAVSADPALSSRKPADPNRVLDEQEKPEQKETAQQVPEPVEPSIPSPPLSQPDVPAADEREPVLEIPDQDSAPDTDGGALAAGAAADEDGAAPARVANVGTPGDTTPVAEAGVGDPEENCIPNDAPGAEQLGTGPDTESDIGDCRAAIVPLPAAEDPVPDSTVHVESVSVSAPVRAPTPEPPAAPAVRARQPAIHRDRRGKRRAVAAPASQSEAVGHAPVLAVRPPAEAKLRLSLHPIRRTVRLSVVLTRPDGFPARVTVQAGGGHAVEAYDEQRYDDLDLTWTSELLDGELRLASGDGFGWLRSARQVHIFAQDPNEPELISVSAARVGISHTLVCRFSDAEAVRLAALSTGSPEMQTHEHWQGIPAGWMVLSGYTPVHAATPPLPSGLRSLDPGEGLEISFDAGLAIRARVYAAGHPPRISITPAIGAAGVSIGGEPATLTSDGAWIAPGWDTPGQHIVDVVPGPSASYEIAADPWMHCGWEFWDAHPQRFGDGAREPWARARICGASASSPRRSTLTARACRAGISN